MNRWLLAGLLVITGCRPATKPVPVTFPAPTPEQQVKLAGLETALRGPFQQLDLTWVDELGAVAVPELARLSTNKTLSIEAMDAVLLGMGRALAVTDLAEKPDARNDVVVPPLLVAFGDPDKRIRRSAAFAARFVCDARLTPALRERLMDVDIVHEQAVLALGTNGGEMEVLPIMHRFFAINDGQFRYSCLYALSTMSLRRDVDVARAVREGAGSFAEEHRANALSVADRLAAFRDLQKLLEAGDYANLRERTGKELPATPAAWRDYLLKDYWLKPPATR
jgi:hypothetical protein